jgi:hypothetical protein
VLTTIPTLPAPLAATLERLPAADILRDRRLPGGDPLGAVAVTAGGVWIVEARSWPGASIEVRTAGRGRARDQSLWVDGDDRTELVDALHGRISALEVALGEEVFWTKVRAALCVGGATWPRLCRGLTVGAVGICWPRAVPPLLSGKGPLDHDDRRRLTERLDAALPSLAAPAA